MKYLDSGKGKIRYKIEGAGKPLVLLHGYLENLEIWDDFASDLAEDYRVVSVDLPGHGESDVAGETHNMELLAQAVKSVLEAEEINSATIVGHSLGGYVSLAFLEKYPNHVDRLVLFHSHPFADKKEVKENRDREIELVKKGKKDLIFQTNIPKAFATDNLERFPEEVSKAQKIAMQTEGEGIVANLRGMKNRPDRSELVKNTDKPFLVIAGKKDNYIDYHSVIPEIKLPEQGILLTLENSGHLGFIEEKEKSLHALKDFIPS
jgi:pimeloyl-ACP methyl ester carboxylesterase